MPVADARETNTIANSGKPSFVCGMVCTTGEGVALGVGAGVAAGVGAGVGVGESSWGVA